MHCAHTVGDSDERMDSSVTGTSALGNMSMRGTNAPWSRPRPDTSRRGLKPACLQQRAVDRVRTVEAACAWPLVGWLRVEAGMAGPVGVEMPCNAAALGGTSTAATSAQH